MSKILEFIIAVGVIVFGIKCLVDIHMALVMGQAMTDLAKLGMLYGGM